MIEIRPNWYVFWDTTAVLVALSLGVLFVVHACPHGQHSGFVVKLPNYVGRSR